MGIEEEAARGDVIGDVIVEWYEEKRSAKRARRPVLDRLRADVRAGRVRRVYGFRLDRFLRTGPAEAFEVAKEMHAAGVELITLADGVHLPIGDRIAAARKRVEDEGRSWGRPSVVTTGDLRKMAAMRAEGRTHRDIAMALKLTKATVTRALKRAAVAA